jgi:hypothetical protein
MRRQKTSEEIMTTLPSALMELIADPQGKRAEESILSVVVDLERAGVPPKAVAKAMARVFLSFCMDKGAVSGNFGWASDCLNELGRTFERRAARSRRLWVRNFLHKTGRLYQDAWTEIEVATPPLEKIVEDRLRSINPQGSA